MPYCRRYHEITGLPLSSAQAVQYLTFLKRIALERGKFVS